MEYKKILNINLLDNKTNQPSKFRTRNWFEINDESPRAYNDDDDNNNINNNNNNNNNNNKIITITMIIVITMTKNLECQ